MPPTFSLSPMTMVSRVSLLPIWAAAHLSSGRSTSTRSTGADTLSEETLTWVELQPPLTLDMYSLDVNTK